MDPNEDKKPSTLELQMCLDGTRLEDHEDSLPQNGQQNLPQNGSGHRAPTTSTSDPENMVDEDLKDDNVCIVDVQNQDTAAPSDLKPSVEVFHQQPINSAVTLVALKGNGKGYVIDGFVFIRDRVRNGTMYLKCRNRHCKARAIIGRSNSVSLAGSMHDPVCIPVENLMSYQCLSQITPAGDENFPRDDRFPEAFSDQVDQPQINCCSQENGEFYERGYTPRNENEAEISCHANETIDIDQESQFSLHCTSHSASSLPRSHQASHQTPKLRSRKRKFVEDDLNNGSSSRPYPVCLNPSTAFNNDTTNVDLSSSKRACNLPQILPPGQVQQSSHQIKEIFTAFRYMRNMVAQFRKHQNFPPLKNDLILRAAKGEPTERVPVWVMRQAGRYLPEFQALRKDHDFFEICQTPELACEITLQPIARFDLDAAIIFSDILVIPQVLGIHVEMVTGKGLVFDNTLSSPEDLARLHNDVDVTEALSYVFDAITLTRKRLGGKVPLIGFSGAPWTLMGYCIEGTGNSTTLSKAKKWLYAHPEQSHVLLQLLTDKIVDYLVGQVMAGAQLLQVFDSNVGVLGYDLFMTFALPYLKQIASKVKRTLRETNFEPVPMIVFAKGAHYAIEELSKLEYDVISLDWTIQPEVARKKASPTLTLQGNLDPCAMYATKDQIEELVSKMLNQFGTQRYIANLGHGVYPDFDPESVKTFIDAVHAQSEAINKHNHAENRR